MADLYFQVFRIYHISFPWILPEEAFQLLFFIINLYNSIIPQFLLCSQGERQLPTWLEVTYSYRTHRPVLQLPLSQHHLHIDIPVFRSRWDQLTNPFCEVWSFSWINGSEPTFTCAGTAVNTRWGAEDLSPKVARKPGLCQVCDVEALVGCETAPLVWGLFLDTQEGTSSIAREITEMRSGGEYIE